MSSGGPFANIPQMSGAPEETLNDMKGDELTSLLREAEFDFERRFDERRALEWMQDNW